MDIKQEVLNRLDALASKLGTTAAYLWAVLVTQAKYQGITDIGCALFWGGMAFGLYKLGKLMQSKAEGDKYDSSGFWIGAFLSWAGGLGCVIVFGTCLQSGILELVNPQYYALHELLTTLGK